MKTFDHCVHHNVSNLTKGKRKGGKKESEREGEKGRTSEREREKDGTFGRNRRRGSQLSVILVHIHSNLCIIEAEGICLAC